MEQGTIDKIGGGLVGTVVGIFIGIGACLTIFPPTALDAKIFQREQGKHLL